MATAVKELNLGSRHLSDREVTEAFSELVVRGGRKSVKSVILSNNQLSKLPYQLDALPLLRTLELGMCKLTVSLQK